MKKIKGIPQDHIDCQAFVYGLGTYYKAQLKFSWKALQIFGRHKGHCFRTETSRFICSCGLAEAIRSLRNGIFDKKVKEGAEKAIREYGDDLEDMGNK